MKKSKRLSVLVKIEEAKEREEARRFTEFRKVVNDRKKKLLDMEDYLAEYREKFTEMSRHGSQADRIKSCYAFMSQLNVAIVQQRQVVQDAEDAAERYRQNWIQARRRMDILEKTVDRFRGDELRHEQKMEQLLADEVSRHKRRDR
jgi:flagellar FliJ protein